MWSKRTWIIVGALTAGVAASVIWNHPYTAVAVWALKAGKEFSPPSAPPKKPICTSPVNPNVAAPTDCIPRYIANLPPDPGAAGKQTVEGIDSDNDGVRDDVQRFIAMNWGGSERAVKTLTVIAKSMQMQTVLGDSLGRDESQKRAAPTALAAGTCYALTASPEMLAERAMEKVQAVVMNTPERFARVLAFSQQVGHAVYPLGEIKLAEACGFDPASIPN